jgi:hypothetical protein
MAYCAIETEELKNPSFSAVKLSDKSPVTQQIAENLGNKGNFVPTQGWVWLAAARWGQLIRSMDWSKTVAWTDRFLASESTHCA